MSQANIRVVRRTGRLVIDYRAILFRTLSGAATGNDEPSQQRGWGRLAGWPSSRAEPPYVTRSLVDTIFFFFGVEW